MADSPPAPDCLACGACCHSRLARYARVTGDDYARLGDAAAELVVFDGHRAFMRMEAGRCAALVSDGTRGEHRCTIYARRPQVCRALERGSPACDAERSLKGERALVTLRRAR